MDEAIDAAAAEWFAAQASDEMDWEGFTAWLEADSRHREAFDAIALLDDEVTTHRVAIRNLLEEAPQPFAVETPPRRWQWPALGAGLAAAIVAGVVLVPSQQQRPDSVWQTGAATQTIALADDAQVVLAPRSRLVAQGGDARHLALEGAAYFDVAHRPDRALTIAAGGYQVRDIGTRFEISSIPSATRVAVAEGQVSVARGDADPISLTAGHGLIGRGTDVSVAPLAADQVASWRRGTLVYAHIPLALVADDIARYSGIGVTVDPSLADRPFSGALTVGEGAGLTNALAAIPDVQLRRDGRGVHIEPRRSGGG
jgi:transmembrane sensor